MTKICIAHKNTTTFLYSNRRDSTINEVNAGCSIHTLPSDSNSTLTSIQCTNRHYKGDPSLNRGPGCPLFNYES